MPRIIALRLGSRSNMQHKHDGPYPSVGLGLSRVCFVRIIAADWDEVESRLKRLCVIDEKIAGGTELGALNSPAKI